MDPFAHEWLPVSTDGQSVRLEHNYERCAACRWHHENPEASHPSASTEWLDDMCPADEIRVVERRHGWLRRRIDKVVLRFVDWWWGW